MIQLQRMILLIALLIKHRLNISKFCYKKSVDVTVFQHKNRMAFSSQHGAVVCAQFDVAAPHAQNM